MSHLIETMAYAGEKPWHGLGVNVNANLTAKQMLKAAGLDWTVSQQPIYLSTDGKKTSAVIPNRVAIVRDKDQKIFDISSQKWNPVQNEDAFEFFHKFVKEGKMAMETAGSIDEGKRIWGLARMKGNDFSLPGGDRVEGYMLLASPHVVGESLTIAFTPIRVVCNNTLSMALNRIERGLDSKFKMHHGNKFDDSIKEQAEIALGLSKDLMKEYKEQAEFLSKKRATEKSSKEFFMELLTPPKLRKAAEEAGEELESNRTVDSLMLLLDHQPGADMSPGSWWNTFNAFTFYTDHVQSRTADKRLRSSWFGSNREKKMKAMEMALDFAGKSRNL